MAATQNVGIWKVSFEMCTEESFPWSVRVPCGILDAEVLMDGEIPEPLGVCVNKESICEPEKERPVRTSASSRT